MQILYYKDKLPDTIKKSIFLAGCSLRPDQDGVSWRKDAIKILEDIGFDGVVFCPENKDGKFDEDHDYAETVEWEELGLKTADVILFWVPRDVNLLPGFTTNVEFGMWCHSGKLVLGYPEDAEKMRYMQHYCDKLNIATSNSLTDTLRSALDFVGKGVERSGGERSVPLYIWNTPQFQSWHQSQIAAGNRLDSADVLYTFRPGNKKFVFLTILHVDVYVASEDRHKVNEFVISRTDISSIVLWRRDEDYLNSEVVLVREFRSPAATSDGFILENVGGSSGKDGMTAQEILLEEVKEETGFDLELDRIKFVGAKQLAGTLSSHKAHTFSYELTDSELQYFVNQKGIVHGNISDSEIIHIKVLTLAEVLKSDVDWTTLGQILNVISIA